MLPKGNMYFVPRLSCVIFAALRGILRGTAMNSITHVA